MESAGGGDTVTLLPGTYDLDTETSDGLDVSAAVTVQKAAGQPKPLLTGSSGKLVSVFSGGAVLQDVKLDVGGIGGNRAVDLLNGSRGQRLEVTVSSGGGAAVQVRDGAVLRDSIVWIPGVGGDAVVTGGSGGTLRNVTAVGEDLGVSSNSTFGTPQTVNVKNVIAMATTTGHDDIQAIGSGITAHVDHSNYDNKGSSGGATIFEEGGIQTAAPSFVDATAGNFHEAAGSPTIDAGTTTDPLGLIGPADLDGEARAQGAAIDIGADEFTVAPPPPATDTTPPNTAIGKGPKKRTHSRSAKFTFSSDEPGSTFQCKLDRKPFKPCSSPKRYKKLKRKKHRFQVEAIDAAGNADPTPAKFKWKVLD